MSLTIIHRTCMIYVIIFTYFKIEILYLGRIQIKELVLSKFFTLTNWFYDQNLSPFWGDIIYIRHLLSEIFYKVLKVIFQNYL